MDLDDAQLALIQYAKWYKRIYELPPTEKPTDDVIGDDAELDRWWNTFLADAQRKAGKAAGKQRWLGPEDIGDTAIPFYSET